ncbi:MAG: ATP-binding protein [Desulfurococcales archaeon]|nr:ATP-binding protein [Desulfurococcales archaeon]
MQPHSFVDRRSELELLEGLWSKGRGLGIVYGRRRIGKTRLLLKWVEEKPHVYYQAGFYSHDINLQGLARAFEEYLGIEGLSKVKFSGLDVLLEHVLRIWRGKLVIIIDEITYWTRSYPGVVSEVQRFIDHVLPGFQAVIVLTGSIVGVVTRDLVGGGSPLFGRASLRIRLGELSPWCLPYFLSRYGGSGLVEAYSLVGGVPYYLVEWPDELEPLDAYLRMFAPGGTLEDEPLMLLREEVRNPSPYISIVRAIAEGMRTIGRISNYTGLPLGHVSRYLSTLIQLGLVGYEPLVPRRRKGRLLAINDRLLKSYYTLIEPYRHILSTRPGKIPEPLRTRYRAIVADGWERLASHHALTQLAPQLGIAVSEAGRLVFKGDEVDYVIIDSDNRRVLAVEAKWSPLTKREIQDITRETRIKVHRLLPGYNVTVALYAREASEPNLDDAMIITPEDLPWKRDCR